jgi:hypothetical protein
LHPKPYPSRDETSVDHRPHHHHPPPVQELTPAFRGPHDHDGRPGSFGMRNSNVMLKSEDTPPLRHRHNSVPNVHEQQQHQYQYRSHSMEWEQHPQDQDDRRSATFQQHPRYTVQYDDTHMTTYNSWSTSRTERHTWGPQYNGVHSGGRNSAPLNPENSSNGVLSGNTGQRSSSGLGSALGSYPCHNGNIHGPSSQSPSSLSTSSLSPPRPPGTATGPRQVVNGGGTNGGGRATREPAGSRTQHHAPLEPEVVDKLNDLFFKFLQRICCDCKCVCCVCASAIVRCLLCAVAC